MSLELQIRRAIKATMPASAEIHVVPGIGSLNLSVSWNIHDDPERPNKMSKTILICVSREAEDDFANALAKNQNAAYQQVLTYLSARLAEFDPQHKALRSETPPYEQWVINSAIVLG